ncbi:MAG: KOW domain-containing RNA-binding protein, partial [Clostridiales bacterium]|nr:KOW domain-containing RNA-binding protein [Clostridiales bacterium]
EFKIGSVVKSKAGRDAGKFLTVVGFSETYILVCDGKERPLERPKLKNPRHLLLLSVQLPAQKMATNRELRKALKVLSENEIQGG